MLALYLLVTVGGIFLIYFSDQTGSDSEQMENYITGLIYVVIGPVLGLLYLVGLVLPRKSFTWIYGIVMIAISFTSCCFVPATVPLLIFWLKPETKAYLGRK